MAPNPSPRWGYRTYYPEGYEEYKRERDSHYKHKKYGEEQDFSEYQYEYSKQRSNPFMDDHSWDDINTSDDSEIKKDVFGLRKCGSREDLDKCYKMNAKIYHPDKGGSHEEFIDLKDTYDRMCLIM
tara:strand:- start:577 stop:954 length:378 start_codon:yes stop_codon:yes gene_type:complete